MIANFEHASQSIKGAREYQEDACAFAFAGAQAGSNSAMQTSGSGMELVAVLADGMGGHIGGARASATACDRFISVYSEQGGSTDQRLQTAPGRSAPGTFAR